MTSGVRSTRRFRSASNLSSDPVVDRGVQMQIGPGRLMIGTPWAFGAACMAMLLGTSCGGSDGDSGAVDPGPTPAEMCADGWPIAAAYDRETGGFQWASCTPEGGLFLMEAASDDTVWLQKSGVESEHWELDAATGTVSARGEGVNSVSDVPDDADRPVDTPPRSTASNLAAARAFRRPVPTQPRENCCGPSPAPLPTAIPGRSATASLCP